MMNETLEDRADRLINHGYLIAMADLVRDKRPEIAREMLTNNGISREKLLGAKLQPYDLKLLLPLYPANPSRGFVNGNQDPRTVMVTRPPVLRVLDGPASHGVERALREDV